MVVDGPAERGEEALWGGSAIVEVSRTGTRPDDHHVVNGAGRHRYGDG